ncbi:MAG: RNA polymerase sigma factor [Isosphaeraceae bacterium]
MDSDELGALIDRHAAALELYARQWCDDPQDVVQEAFVKLAGQRPPPRNAPAWLFRAIRHGAINAGVARRRRGRREAQAVANTSAWFEPDHAGAVDHESAQDALARLPAEQREVIVAHLWGGLTFAQVAELAGLSSSSVHRLYQAGLAALRERLGVSCRTNPSRTTPG